MSMAYECHSKKKIKNNNYKKKACGLDVPIDQNAFRFPSARPNMVDAWIRNSDWEDDMTMI